MKTEFNKEVETLRRTLAKMRRELKNSISQLENSGKSLTSRMSQLGDRMPGLKDKVEGLDKTCKDYEKIQSTGKEHVRNMRCLRNIGTDEGKNSRSMIKQDH